MLSDERRFNTKENNRYRIFDHNENGPFSSNHKWPRAKYNNLLQETSQKQVTIDSEKSSQKTRTLKTSANKAVSKGKTRSKMPSKDNKTTAKLNFDKTRKSVCG